MAGRKVFVPRGRVSDYVGGDAHLYLMKPGRDVFSDVELIRFSTRKALEAFNVRAGLAALVPTIVPKGCAVYRHEREARDDA